MENLSNATHEEKHALLSEDGPHSELYKKAVPIWCGKSPDDLEWDVGEGIACGYARGFEEGIVMAMLRPEWVQGLYHRLRLCYLTTHTPEDLLDWEQCAEETAQAMPIRGESSLTSNDGRSGGGR